MDSQFLKPVGNRFYRVYFFRTLPTTIWLKPKNTIVVTLFFLKRHLHPLILELVKLVKDGKHVTINMQQCNNRLVLGACTVQCTCTKSMNLERFVYTIRCEKSTDMKSRNVKPLCEKSHFQSKPLNQADVFFYSFIFTIRKNNTIHVRVARECFRSSSSIILHFSTLLYTNI